MSTEPAMGIQLKEGSFTLPVQAKYRVDVTAIKEIPRKFEICEQGIESLNDLFYEAPPEQKEGVLVQKAIWENVRERILDMKVFNAASSYTDLSNQMLPIRILLPENKQYFPTNLILKKEPTNPFRETKRFARELLDIIAAIKTLREEKLFQYQDFHIYPTRDTFIITDTETGDRRLTAGIHSVAPEELKETCSSENLSMQALKDLIQQRWDKREFRKVLNAPDLNGMFQVLKKLAQDVPTWKMILIKSGYAAVYTAIGFVIFSLLMFLSGFIPGNQALLEEMKINYIQDTGKLSPLIASSIVGLDATAQPSEGPYIRIVLDSQKNSDMVQVVGNFRSSFRLGKLGEFPFFNLLDRLYNLDYKAPLKIKEFKCEPELTLVQIAQTVDESTFRFRGLNKWGRERFRIVSAAPAPTGKKEEKEIAPQINLEIVLQKPSWALEMNPNAVAFQQAEAGTEAITSDNINIYANPTDEEKEKGEKVAEANLLSYFTVSFDRLGVPMQIHYLDPKGDPIARLVFDSFEDGRLKAPPKLFSVKIDKKKKDEGRDEEEGDPEDEEGEEESTDRKDRSKQKKLPKVKKSDIFWLKRTDVIAQLALQEGIISKEQLAECTKLWENIPGKEMGDVLLQKKYISDKQHKEFMAQHLKEGKGTAKKSIQDVYYRHGQLPKNVNSVKVAVLSNHLPNEEVKGTLHIAVPGVDRPLTVPITFHPKQKVEFDPPKMTDIRDEVTGLAFPIELRKMVWGKQQKFNPHELRYFTFHFNERPETPRIEGFGPIGIGLQIKEDPNTIYFYNTTTGETNTITEYSRKSGKIYFAAKKSTYGKAENEFFEVLDKKDLNAFGIREAVAKTTTHLYMMILTDKNVEDTTLTLKWRGGELAASFPVSARSREALRIVQWKPESAGTTINRYTKKDWINQVSIKGPLGAARYQAIIFSGEQPDKDVSDEVFIQIQDQELLNVLYQTVDGDWFANLDEKFGPIKLLSNPPSQLNVKKFSKEKREGDKSNKDAYFRAEQKEIGRVNQYLLVPGKGVLPGQEEKKTQIKFYYPAKDMESVLDVAVSCEAPLKSEWNVVMDDQKKNFQIRVGNYPRHDARKLADKFLFLTTCAAVALLHNQYQNEFQANDEDKKWAETIRWSLQSIGQEAPHIPPTVLGALGGTIEQAIRKKNIDGIKAAYQIIRETMLLSWSPQAQSLLEQHLELKSMAEAILAGNTLKGKSFDLNVNLQPLREAPFLVSEPERFVEVSLTVPYDQLLFEKKAAQVYQFREQYYYGIPKNFTSAGNVTSLLTELYPYPDAFPKQTISLEKSGIQISETLYPNLLQYSLWEHRINDFNKEESKAWVAMLGVTTEIADADGKIDPKEVNRIAEEIQKKWRSYFLSPLNIRRMFWTEVKDKVRGEAVKNRDTIGKEEQTGITQFVERAMMSQFTENKCWYTNFTFVVDRLMLDRCPYHNWIYVKTYRPTVEGLPGEMVKLRIFKRDGLSLSPYPGQEYAVDIYTYGDSYDKKVVTVKGLTVFQDWFDVHPCNEVGEAKIKDRLRVKFYYQEGGEEKELIRPGTGGPPILDFQAHPASIILFEISGYHVSPDRLRQMQKDFTIQMPKGTNNLNFTFSFDNGPILVPFAYRIKRSNLIKTYNIHILNWKQDPPPEEEDRNLVSLNKNYEMEYLFVDSDAQLPMAHFFPYNNLGSICRDYDERRIFSNRMLDLLDRLFTYSDQIPSAVKFKWDKDLTDFYKQEINKDQMFQYSYQSGHSFRISAPSYFELPKDFKGKTHPDLTEPPGRNMAIIWRIVPSKENQKVASRGFPKYILEKKFFPNSEPVFSKD